MTQDIKNLKTVREAAELIGLTEMTLRNWIYQGKIRAVKVGGFRVYIPDEEINRVTKEQKKVEPVKPAEKE